MQLNAEGDRGLRKNSSNYRKVLDSLNNLCAYVLWIIIEIDLQMVLSRFCFKKEEINSESYHPRRSCSQATIGVLKKSVQLNIGMFCEDSIQ